MVGIDLALLAFGSSRLAPGGQSSCLVEREVTSRTGGMLLSSPVAPALDSSHGKKSLLSFRPDIPGHVILVYGIILPILRRKGRFSFTSPVSLQNEFIKGKCVTDSRA